MPKYEIYQLGKLPPLTVVEADNYMLNEYDVLNFSNSVGDIVATFNWHNIAGIKKIEEV